MEPLLLSKVKRSLVLVVMVVRAKYLIGVEAFGHSISQKVSAGLAGGIATLVQKQVREDGNRYAYAVRLAAWSLKEKEK